MSATAGPAALSSSQVRALTTQALGSYGSAELLGFTSVNIAGLTSRQIAALSTGQIQQLSTAAIPGLVSATVRALASAQVGQLGTGQVAAFSTVQVGALSSLQLGALSTTQLAALTTAQVVALSTAGVVGLTSGQMSALSTVSLRALETRDVAALRSTQLGGLSTGQIVALSGAQVAAMGSAQLGGLTSSQLGVLTTEQLAVLGSGALRGLRTAQLAAFTSVQLKAIATGLKAAFTTAQLSALSTAQFNAIYVTPIVLDLNSDGVSTRSIEHGVPFDIDADGRVDRTAWVDAEDGLLARDINRDGMINDGSELFGSATQLAEKGKAKDGFEALESLDVNQDGWLDASDSSFEDLKVWVDKNSDGFTDDGELLPLGQVGVRRIDLSAEPSEKVSQGNLIGLVSEYENTQGGTGEVADVWFQVSPSELLDEHAALLGQLLKNPDHPDLSERPLDGLVQSKSDSEMKESPQWAQALRSGDALGNFAQSMAQIAKEFPKEGPLADMAPPRSFSSDPKLTLDFQVVNVKLPLAGGEGDD